jgi:prevent-host-death family protein
MQTVNIHDARTHFSMLVDAAANGEEITITKAGKPVARLGPIQGDRAPRRFGGLKGRVKIADDFDAPLPVEMIAVFGGR